MKYEKNESDAIQATIDEAAIAALQELDSLQLALIGGGIGDFVQ